MVTGLLQRYTNTQIYKRIRTGTLHARVCTHTITRRSPMCANSVTHGTAERTRKITHLPTQSHTELHSAHTHTQGSKATGPSLPAACTMHNLGVRGCIPDRRRQAGRTPAGMGQDPSIRWPSRGVRPWHPIHSHLCSGPAGKQGPWTKPPWPAIGYKGGHVGPHGGPPSTQSSKLSLWLSLSKL